MPGLLNFNFIPTEKGKEETHEKIVFSKYHTIIKIWQRDIISTISLKFFHEKTTEVGKIFFKSIQGN